LRNNIRLHLIGNPEDKPNFSLFINEFRQAINEELLDENKEPLILSAAVAAGKARIDKGYEIDKIAKDLDFINLMT
jgi:GH18 family chitinase